MPTHIVRPALLLTAIFALLLARASAAPFTLSDLRYLNDVRDPQVSPDGRSVAYVSVKPDFERDRYVERLAMVDLITHKSRDLTPRRTGVASPRWSPDGRMIAFIDDAGSGEAKKAQVFLIPAHGGPAKQLTRTGEDVEQLSWRPDGKTIAYVVTDAPPKRRGIARFEDAFVVGDNDYLAAEMSRPAHIWLVGADGKYQHRLTWGPHGLPSMTPPYTEPSPIVWSPDGRYVAYARLPRAYQDEANLQQLWRVDAVTGKTELFIAGSYTMMPQYAPDGKRILFSRPRDGDYNNVTQISVSPAHAAARGSVATADLDRNVQNAWWMPGSKAILLYGDDGTRTALWLQHVGGAVMRLDLGALNPGAVSVGKDGSLAFTASVTQRPDELYYVPAAEMKRAEAGLKDARREAYGGSAVVPSTRVLTQRLTDVNRKIAALELGASESIAWDGPDGFREDGLLTYPPGFMRGRRYPLVLVIHGGPIGNSNSTFSELTQLLSAAGYLVFEPNYRGSDDAGNAFERAIYRDAGDGPGRDVMAGVSAVQRRGIVDDKRMGVSGWSYGGFMTSWMITHYHMWKAAVSGAAVNDWTDDYALADDRTSDVLQLGSRPYVGQGLREWAEQSPITYASSVTTPTLIMCDTGDVRVPIPESYKMYLALRDNNVRTEFVAYPVSGHLPSDPVRNADIDRRWVAWIEKYLR